MIAALILCAGEGRRLGGVDKAGLRLPDGRTFLDAVAATARAAGCGPILAVGRAGSSYAIETLINPAPERGMISSIVVGLAALAARDVAAALVWPVDQPLVTSATVAAIVAAAGPDRIVVPTHAGRGGHPTAFGRALWPELAAAASARDVVRADPGRVVRLAVDDDEGVVVDFDIPSDIRVRGLAKVDPLGVPLPHGTEVVTRVGRADGERTVPEGAVGRVVGSSGDGFDVHIVGGGTFRYARDELVPRRAGQARFAMRRAAVWDALRPCVVLEATVGSRAWGLADEGSDTDVRGVFVLPFSWTTGLGEPPGEIVSPDGSTTYWEMGKAIRQAIRADPNTLETLFVASARALDPMGQVLLDARDAFVSAEMYGSFGRYALSQVAKLRQSLRLAEHRTAVLAWLRETPGLSLDETAARLADVAVRDAPSIEDASLRAKEYIKQLYGSMYDQGLVSTRDFGGLVAFARGGGGALDLPRELRPKNAYNLLRLIAVAADWLRTGRPALVVAEPLRSQLLAIKRGEVPLADVLLAAERMTPALEEARRETPLPRRADLPRADALLRWVREETARRAVSGAPGPFGRDAAPVPTIDWEDA